MTDTSFHFTIYRSSFCNTTRPPSCDRFFTYVCFFYAVREKSQHARRGECTLQLLPGRHVPNLLASQNQKREQRDFVRLGEKGAIAKI
uniref:hypothetical protein n=1 Tax=uncultured Nostoc sp. TaxID=340711 RepID=UPI002629376E